MSPATATANPTPREAGFAMPAEWAPHTATWMTWPTNPALWPDRFKHIESIFTRLAATISQFETVHINAHPTFHPHIEHQLADADVQAFRLFPHPSNDVWCRDHGPTFLRHPDSGEIALVDWTYNAWGGKFPPWDLDDAIPRRISETTGLRRFAAPLVCEGGAIETNGHGRILTTESVLLNPNRNPNLDKAKVERLLSDFLGADEILWLPGGLEGDDTDGHIDTLSRFFSANAVLTAIETHRKHPNHTLLTNNKQILIDYGLEVVELPQPAPIRAPKDWRQPFLPGSYANFLIVNNAVIVPTYQQPEADQRALEIIGSCFPHHQITPFDCLDLLLEGGAIHCLTQQQPA